MNKKNGTMAKVRGFTLVELLVVISIIALLLSVLMPALSKVREQAMSVVCTSNLKQIVLASSLWSTDNQNWCIPAFCLQGDPLWGDLAGGNQGVKNPGSLQSYINEDMYKKKSGGKVMACPAAKNVVPYLHGGWSGNAEDVHKRFSYAPNGYMTTNSWTMEGVPRSPGTKPTRPTMRWDLDGTEPKGPAEMGNYAVVHGVTKISAVRQPTQTLYFIDCDAPVANKSSVNPFVERNLMQMTDRNGRGPASRWHSRKRGSDYGYGNIGWVDGHASKEPADFTGGTRANQRCWYYFYGL